MAALLADENFPQPVVHALRTLGHNVLTLPPEPEAATAYTRLRRYFVHLDGVDLALPLRQPGRRSPEFD